MTSLKPSPLRAFLKMLLFMFLGSALVHIALPLLKSEPVRFDQFLELLVFGGIFSGIGGAAFTPREVLWDDERIRIRTLVFGSGEFQWEQLEAYSSYGTRFGTFLVKFEGRQAFQMVPVGFQRDDWETFQSFLRERFPDKKTWMWFGPIPLRFKKG